MTPEKVKFAKRGLIEVGIGCLHGGGYKVEVRCGYKWVYRGVVYVCSKVGVPWGYVCSKVGKPWGCVWRWICGGCAL